MKAKTNISIIVLIGIANLLTFCTKPPVPCFATDKGQTSRVNEEVQFDATCTTEATSYSWNYGDGNSGTGITSKHKYQTVGTYIVTLTASNKGNSSIIEKNMAVTP